jgi:hypothetical protein
VPIVLGAPARARKKLSTLRKDDERVRLYSRPGKDLTRRFPLIVDALSTRHPLP